MSRALVLYASHFGQTRAIARSIAERLRDHGHDVEVVDAKGPDVPPPTAYDVVVLGSRIEMGRHAPEIRAYIVANRNELARRKTAFFSVSMAAANGGSSDPNGYLSALFDDVGWTPTKRVAIAGALPYRKYNWLLRMIMKRISRSAHHPTDTSRNHEATDWNQVTEFADVIDKLLPRAVSARV